MIIPDEGVDDLGQEAEATFTFLRYSLELVYRVDERLPFSGSFELVREGLEHIKLGKRGDTSDSITAPKTGGIRLSKGAELRHSSLLWITRDSWLYVYTRMAAAVAAPNHSRPAVFPALYCQPSTRRKVLPPCLPGGRCSPGVCSSWNRQRCADLTSL